MKIDISSVVKCAGAVMAVKHSEKLEEGTTSNFPVSFTGTADFDGMLTNINDVLRLEGKVKIGYNVPCDRCASELKRDMTIKVFEQLVDEGKVLSEGNNNDDHFTVEGNQLDIGRIITEYILLYMPMNHLCSERCKGICLKCGQNLNETDCKCTGDDNIDPRMEMLKDFLTDK